ncbi:MAG: metallophosphoesterase, partial [Anaerotignum sp.]
MFGNLRRMIHRQWKVFALSAAMIVGMAVPALAAEEVTVTILQTSDLHGMVNPFDYAANKENAASMAHVSTIVAEERAKTPNLLLIDTGDGTQGNYIQEFRQEKVHPMVKALNTLDYDAWVLGNHEFNFEF